MRYHDLTFTHGVRAAQRDYLGVELDAPHFPEPRITLGAREEQFIAARDSFFLASVSETGWPYVQHRGGPKGFLKVLDAQTLGLRDYQGNRQFLSLGNIRGDDRVSLILLDYPERRRLKVLGRCRVVDGATLDPALAERLDRTGAFETERVLLIRVEAFDWNCSKYITPRYTEEEWAARQSSI
jgi:predicted pyridoxine 5'-phosphate oxidase superfamily flavin-nucleotide-binding protein